MKLTTVSVYFLFAVSLSLSACVTPVSSRPSADLLPTISAPANWIHLGSSKREFAIEPQSPTTDLTLWWSVFQDVQLNGVMTRAMAANSNIAIAKAALIQSRALRDAAAASLYPHIDLSISAQRNKNGNMPSIYGYRTIILGLFSRSFQP